MSNKITDKATSTTTPTNWFVNIAGAVKQLTAAAFNTLIGALIGPRTAAASGKTTPVNADKIPLADSADSDATKHVTLENLKAVILDAAILTGNATAVTQSAGDNSTRIATTAFIQAALNALLDGAPGALDTLNELAAAVNDDASFAATVTTALAGKVPVTRTINGQALSADITLASLNASALDSGTIPDARFPSTLPALNGSALTALNAGNLASGTIPDARFPATLPALNGSALTALNASNIASGTVPDARFPATLPALNGSALTALNASNLASGTLPDARFPAALPALNGSALTALNAGNISSGTLGAARLPAPGTTTLGGVKRNTGSAGEFVNGIDADGALIFDTPAGGGGSSLLRGVGILKGYDSEGIEPTGPPSLSLDWVTDAPCVVTLTVNGVATVFTISSSDPANGSVWVDSSGYMGFSDYATGLRTAIDAQSISDLSSELNGNEIIVVFSTTGAAASLAGACNNSNVVVTGGGFGTDGEPPTGEVVTEAEIIEAVPATGIRCVRVFIQGEVDGDVRVCLKHSGSYYDVVNAYSNGPGAVPFEMLPGDIDMLTYFMSGLSGGESLVVLTNGSPTVGQVLKVFAIVEQS